MIDYQDKIALLQNFPEGATQRRQNNIVNKHATIAVISCNSEIMLGYSIYTLIHYSLQFEVHITDIGTLIIYIMKVVSIILKIAKPWGRYCNLYSLLCIM